MTRPFDLTLEGSPDPTAGLGFSLFVAPRVPEVGADGSEALRELVKGQPLNPGPAVRVKLSPRGEILEKQAPERTPRRPSESELGILDGLIIPLPEQPVGVGATWRINRTERPRLSRRHGLEVHARRTHGQPREGQAHILADFRAADEDALTKVKKELPTRRSRAPRASSRSQATLSSI